MYSSYLILNLQRENLTITITCCCSRALAVTSLAIRLNPLPLPFPMSMLTLTVLPDFFLFYLLYFWSPTDCTIGWGPLNLVNPDSLSYVMVCCLSLVYWTIMFMCEKGWVECLRELQIFCRGIIAQIFAKWISVWKVHFHPELVWNCLVSSWSACLLVYC